MARHRQIGAVELEREAGGDDRLVLRLHRLADRLDVLLVGREVVVALEGGDETWRGGVEEGVGRAAAGGGHRRVQVGEVGLEIGVADVLDRSDARLALERLGAAGRRRQPAAQLGVRGEVERRLARRVAVEAGQPVFTYVL